MPARHDGRQRRLRLQAEEQAQSRRHCYLSHPTGWSSGASGGAGPSTRAGLDAGRGAGPVSLSSLLDCDGGGGRAGPSTLRRFSLGSGLVERSRSSSRVRFARCGGNEGPMGIVLGCGCGDSVVRGRAK